MFIKEDGMNYGPLVIVMALCFGVFATSKYPIKWLKSGICWLAKRHPFGSIHLDG
jgi:hypothetical protein